MPDITDGAAHVFVDDLARPALCPADEGHLRRSLRLRPGAAVTAADGAGSWRPCRLGSDAWLEPLDDVRREPAPTAEVVVAFALVKGDRPEWVVQKLTEVGADRIIPLRSQRTVVRWAPEREARNLDRLRRVAREAGMQSRRARLPEVAPVADAAAVLGSPGAALAAPDGAPLLTAEPWPAVVVVGPEGGFTDAERAQAPLVVGLGPHVLRTETAAVAAGVLLVARRPASTR